ncbi:MAG: shikimate kinase [Candidatus Aenigmarchaeota archaeon]|nr:shikimate kinase [Candidatus Aenigmarchaeota archaeon]
MENKSNISLIGFWATGKTTIGKELARKLNMDFVDIDQIIENKSKMSIFEMFEKLGEEKFREMEIKEMDKIQTMKNTVIACGAGVVLNNINMKNLKQNSVVIWLDANSKEIAERIKKDKNFRILRPKELTLDRIDEFLGVRNSLYKKYCDFKIDTFGKSISQNINEILENLKIKF